jgi:hypothetical protein
MVHGCGFILFHSVGSGRSAYSFNDDNHGERRKRQAPIGAEIDRQRLLRSLAALFPAVR